MKSSSKLLGTALLYLGLSLQVSLNQEERSPSVPTALDRELAANRELLRRYCLRCHGTRKQEAGLSLADFDPAAAVENPEIAEKVIHKLRSGLMPPPRQRRPEDAASLALAVDLEERLDAAAAANPEPGRRSFQRLNRAEYANAIRDLLSVRVDVAAFLPPDTISNGFDNIADVQNLSPTLMEGYLRAASEISRLALGDPEAVAAEATYKVPRTASQLEQVDGAPFGTRGGIALQHNFPADGEYVFKIQLHSGPTGFLFGMTAKDEQLEVSVNGARVALLDIDRFMSESDPLGMYISTPAVFMRAGPQRIAAAFIRKAEGPVEDLLAPIEHSLADTMIGAAYGITTRPHLRDLIISGPRQVTGVSNTPSRRIIFTRRPLTADEQLPIATEILSRLATQAYRRPIDAEDLRGLVSFYKQGAADGDFEAGIRLALQAILASPHFIFRVESPAEGAAAGETYPLGDLDLASRLSFFLWTSIPDEELLDLAISGELSKSETYEQQVRRMLADPRAEALASRFASQWLRLQDLENIHPDALQYPQFDKTLGRAMRRETELFFDHLLREDRSVLDLITADYSFLDERLARHYGIPEVNGREFRRVELPGEERRGILGHGSILTLTSHANRTSPVLRGKWVMEVLLGTSPPPPPPDVPELDETVSVAEGRLLSVRERLEEHRSNPACAPCHRVIDPLGLALENFDVTGAWRIKDSGAPVDPSGTFYDGSELNGPGDLRAALLKRPEAFLRSFTEYLMTYALGRRLEYYDMPAVRKITRDAANDDHRLSTYILGVTQSVAFRMSRKDGETGR